MHLFRDEALSLLIIEIPPTSGRSLRLFGGRISALTWLILVLQVIRTNGSVALRLPLETRNGISFLWLFFRLYSV